MKNRLLTLFPNIEEHPEPAIHERSSVFVDNMSLPIHRWFRYSAGFSAEWVEQEIGNALHQGAVKVLDPFAGVGTTLLAAEHCGVPGIGLEAHPFVYRIARAKLAWREPVENFLKLAREVRSLAQRQQGDHRSYPPLIQKCYPTSVLAELDALKKAWEKLADGSPVSELVWLAITSILRICSPVGTAQWQYVLPKKEKANPLMPFLAYDIQIRNMADDMRHWQSATKSECARVYLDDARECKAVPEGWATLILTSPPYTNNYDYADATRLEMSFWGEVHRWSDLHAKVRRYLIRSCTQHVAADREKLELLLADPAIAPILDEMKTVCQRLMQERSKHGGKKPYHLMIAAYFSDMARVWKALRRVTARKGCLVCFVIGDSAPYGVHVPVDRWLGELAMSAGFHSYHFEKIRDRNIKWRNRKHRVPLQEGRLWVRG